MKTPVCSQVVKESGPHLMVNQLLGLLFSREESDNSCSMSPKSFPETLPLQSLLWP